jgi:hypothetical protein
VRATIALLQCFGIRDLLFEKQMHFDATIAAAAILLFSQDARTSGREPEPMFGWLGENVRLKERAWSATSCTKAKSALRSSSIWFSGSAAGAT